MADPPPRSGVPDPAAGEPDQPASAAPGPAPPLGGHSSDASERFPGGRAGCDDGFPAPPEADGARANSGDGGIEPGDAQRRDHVQQEAASPGGIQDGAAARAGTGWDGDGDTTERDFLDLIARFDEEPGERAWPAAEDVAGTRPPDPILVCPTDPVELPPAGSGTIHPHPGPGRDGGGADDLGEDVQKNPDPDPAPDPIPDPRSGGADDDHYTPPPAPPPPRMRPVTRWALGSIAVGLMILFFPAVFGFDRGRSQDVLGVFLILGGVGTLVARLGERPPTDSDGPDDGAVV